MFGKENCLLFTKMIFTNWKNFTNCTMGDMLKVKGGQRNKK